MKEGSPAEKLLRLSRLGEASRLIFYGVAIGIISGLAAAAFFYVLELASHFCMVDLAGYPLQAAAGERMRHLSSPLEFRRWIFFLLPALGGLISGLIVYTFAPEAEGIGTEGMMEAFHQKLGMIRTRVPLLKAVATLATGGSSGREGPIAQIGGGFGSVFARMLKLNVRERRILLLAGAGGGFGAIFRAPLGGALAALEVLYKEDLETDALIPTVLSSITAYTLFTQIFGSQHIFASPAFQFRDPRELIFYTLLGLVCVPLGIFYIRFFYGVRDHFFRKIKIPRHVKPMLGGLLVGAVGLWTPEAYGGGYGVLQKAILTQLPVTLMAALILTKILTTTFTLASGGSGGVFGPTLFIGGMIGGTVGWFGHQFFPEIVTQPGAFVIVGMASFFAGVANAPLASLIMCAEMTGGYGLIAPLLLVSVIAILFTRRYSIYEQQVQNKFHSPAHLGDFTINVLEELTVEKVYDRGAKVRVLSEELHYGEIQRVLMESESASFPLADAQGHLVGMLSLDQTRPILFEDGLEDLLIASDLAGPAVTITPDRTLYEALAAFLSNNTSELLVVDPEHPNTILGILRHSDLIRAYNEEIIRRNKQSGHLPRPS